MDVQIQDSLNTWRDEIYGSMGFQERVSQSYVEVPGIGQPSTLLLTKDSIELGIKDQTSFLIFTQNYSDVGVKENVSELLYTQQHSDVAIKDNISELRISHAYIEVVGLVDDGIAEPPDPEAPPGPTPTTKPDTDCGSSTSGTGRDDDCYGTVSSEDSDLGILIAVRKTVCVGNDLFHWQVSVATSLEVTSVVALSEVFADTLDNWNDEKLLTLKLSLNIADDLNNWLDVQAQELSVALVTAGLVAWYKFDDGSGDVLTDYSGNGNHGQLGSTSGSDTNDPTWVTEGLSFDGVDNYVQLNAGTFTFAGEFTIMVAFTPSSLSGFRAIVGGDTVACFMRNDGGNNYYIRLNSADDTALTAPGVGTWEVLTVRRDASGKIDVFQNAGSANRIFSDAAQTETVQFDRLGDRQSSFPWAGSEAVAVYYDAALTDGEITTTNYPYIKALLAPRGITLP